jgi:hypothetical protein
MAEGDAMENRITESTQERGCRIDEPQPIDTILEELLAQYERRFPGARVSVLETAANAY